MIHRHAGVKARDHLNLLWISNSIPDIANALDAGVDWIFIDVETHGKKLRQPKGCFISDHSIADVAKVRSAFPQAKLLVRINPHNQQTTDEEINRAIEFGIDAIMLPFFKTKYELDQVIGIIDGRCLFWPLVETLEACSMVTLGDLSGNGIDQIHIGLNDLRIQLGCRFMFSPMLDPRVASAIEFLSNNHKAFGIGGVSKVDQGALKGSDVLSLHYSLGSGTVILSQEFRKNSDNADLRESVGSLRQCWTKLLNDANNDKDVTLDEIYKKINRVEGSMI